MIGFQKLCILLVVLVIGGGVFIHDVYAAGKFDMGPEISYIKYEEPGVMEQSGIMYGFYARYELPLDGRETDGLFLENTVLNFDGVFKYGQVDYESPVSGTLDNINDYMLEVSGSFGYQIDLSELTVITPYIGLGYRYLNDDSAGMLSSVGHAGYERESNYFYMPIGVRTDIELNDSWNFGLNLEFDLFLGGKQKSHLEDVSSSLNTIENDQKDGYGVRGGVRLVRNSERMDFSIEPFVRWWEVDESLTAVVTCGGTPCALGYEPQNQSFESGIRFGLSY